jgi:hypothetical protein
MGKKAVRLQFLVVKLFKIQLNYDQLIDYFRGVLCYNSEVLGPVAQWLERQPFKLRVAGSIPAGLTFHTFMIFLFLIQYNVTAFTFLS